MAGWQALATEILSWLSIASGGLFLIVGAAGMNRFPDFWSRIHAAGIVDTVGAGLLIAGMMLQAGLTLVTLKLLLIAVFLFITGPTATHAIAQAAFASGLRPPGLRKGLRPDKESPT